MPYKDINKRRAVIKAWKKSHPNEVRASKRKWAKGWRKRNPEKNEAVLKAWDESHPGRKRKYQADYDREKSTGWTAEEYDVAFEEQQGCCAICGVHQSTLKVALNADHSHTTGKKRALLCNRCNIVLGLMKEHVALLEKAIQYLKQYQGDSECLTHT